jgi:hypothetical protein
MNPKTFKKMKKISVLMMSIALVGAIALTSCGAKETKATEETKTECCEKKDTSACCEKKDTCTTPCEGHNADSTKKCAEHKN